MPKDAASVPATAGSATAATPDVETVIVGAGFGGLCAAIRLKRSGRTSFVVLEKADDIGGTWRENDYPGCACDVPSHLYSFSFAPSKEWTRAFAGQAEIWDYMRDCVRRFGLEPHIRTRSEMVEAAWDERAGHWRVTLADGSTVTGRYLVAGLGPLSRPRLPDIPGLERFKGPAFHSSEWRHDVDLSGKRVAVIGTGASAIQFVPQIAPKVASLTLFQRTPAWILPKRDREFGPLERFLIRWVPGWRAALRAWIYGLLEIRALAFTVDQRMLSKPEQMARDHLAAQISDPELRAELTPDYALGCKRVLISNDFYPALERPNVQLATDPIAEVDENGLVLGDGRRVDADVLIYGTGFRPSEPWTPLRIYGRDGAELSEEWREGMEAYYGTMVAGFPNLFVLLGPNSGLGHNSVVIMIEAQVERFMRCLALADRGIFKRIEVRKDVQDRFNDALQERTKRTVWASGCASWYLDKRGRNVTVWPGFSFDFVRRATTVSRDDFVSA